jgi:hypothetical protein
MALVNEYEFLNRYLFSEGDLEVVAVSEIEEPRTLLVLRIPRTDEADVRHVPSVDISSLGAVPEADRRRVMSALVRAGVRHPGLNDKQLRQLHRAQRQEGHIELFCDLNALSTGLTQQLIQSLGARCRVVVSSSSIDILHEYQRGQKKKGTANFLRRAEMNRCLGVLEDLRKTVPVHVHPLPPGATSYRKRPEADPGGVGDSEDDGEGGLTYVSEDRQMVSAFWQYISTTNPRVPVHLVTSDFSLARVCAAERVSFVFARSPYQVWWLEQIGVGMSAVPEVVWLDPFALKLRACSAHRILWELCLVYQRLTVKVKLAADNGAGMGAVLLDHDFGLSYDPRRHMPGDPPHVEFGEAHKLTPSATVGKRAKGTARADSVTTRRMLKLSLQPVLLAMPTRRGQRVPLSQFKPTDVDSARQFEQIGEVTGLFRVEDSQWVVAAEGLEAFLTALRRRDYIAVNAPFKRFPWYSEALADAAVGNRMPSSKKAGAATGWAIVLGASYKTISDGALYGLAEVTEDRFEQAVVRGHAEIGGGQRSVPLPPIMDRVCRSLQLSPIRFEALLEATIGHRGLEQYEVQRAKISIPIPKHSVIVAPATASPDSYLRTLDPGTGLTIGNKLVGALVLRGRGSNS